MACSLRRRFAASRRCFLLFAVQLLAIALFYVLHPSGGRGHFALVKLAIEAHKSISRHERALTEKISHSPNIPLILLPLQNGP